jgi:hypothetical protein
MDVAPTPGRVLPPLDGAVEQLKQRFFNRTDRVAVLASWGKPCPAATQHLDALLRAHILGAQAPEVGITYQFRDQSREETGHYRVGSYSPGAEDRVVWLCVDFDAGGKAYALSDATAAMWATAKGFNTLGIAAYPERSGGGLGWHLWGFCEAPIPAEVARRLALRLVPPGILLADGTPADPKRNRGIEVFPKKTRLNGGLGYSVWLPYWSGAAEGGNQFYTGADDGLVAHAYPAFSTIPASRVDEVLAQPPGSVAASIPAGAPDAGEDAPVDEPDFRAKTSNTGDE